MERSITHSMPEGYGNSLGLVMNIDYVEGHEEHDFVCFVFSLMVIAK